MYLTYEEYRAFGGTLDEAAFGPAEYRARKRIDELTDGRVGRMRQVPEGVKLAVLMVIKAEGAVGAEALADAPAVAAFTSDGYSERYEGASERIANLEEQLNDGLRRLLSWIWDDHGVPLLFRGVHELGTAAR